MGAGAVGERMTPGRRGPIPWEQPAGWLD